MTERDYLFKTTSTKHIYLTYFGETIFIFFINILIDL